MAKVRFYCNVPEYKIGNGYILYANTEPNIAPMPGSKRIAFDVEMPPDLWKSHDLPAQAGNVHLVMEDDTPTPAQALAAWLSAYEATGKDYPELAWKETAFRLVIEHGQYFAGLEAEVEQWKRNTLTFKERGDRLAFDVHSLERKLEAAEARCAELMEIEATLDNSAQAMTDMCRRLREAEGLLREVKPSLAFHDANHRIAAFLAAKG